MQKQRKNKSAGKRGKKSTNPVRRTVAGSEVAVKPHLSKCAVHYGRALSNPFGTFPELPCIPDSIAFPSAKQRYSSRGVFSIGTAGTGYVSMAPAVPFASTTMGWTTLSTFTGTTYEASNGGVDTAVVVNNSPYTSPNGPTMCRLVGAGIKIRYIGTELARGGRVLLYRLPGTGASIAAGLTPAALLTDSTAVSAPVTRKEECVTYVPATSTDLAYVLSTGQSSSVRLLVLVSGAQPSQSFEYEMVQFFEYTGGITTTLTTSHSDPVGMGAVTAAIPRRIPSATPAVAENNMMQKATSSLVDSFSGLIPLAIKGLGAAAGGYFGGPSGALAGYQAGGVVAELPRIMGNPVSVTEID